MKNQAVQVHVQEQATAEQKEADDIALLDHVNLSQIDPTTRPGPISLSTS